jgi:hypothetical protein
MFPNSKQMIFLSITYEACSILQIPNNPSKHAFARQVILQAGTFRSCLHITNNIQNTRSKKEYLSKPAHAPVSQLHIGLHP